MISKIRDADITRIAGELPQWQIVASNLGMGQLDIEDIENNNTAPADQRKSFLRRWIRRDGKAATYERLSEVLESLGEQGAAEKIREIERTERIALRQIYFTEVMACTGDMLEEQLK
eukprot:Em0009g1101a